MKRARPTRHKGRGLSGLGRREGWRCWIDLEEDGTLVSFGSMDHPVAQNLERGTVSVLPPSIAPRLPETGIYYFGSVVPAMEFMTRRGDAVLARVRVPVAAVKADREIQDWPSFYADEVRIVEAFVRPDLLERWPFPTVPAMPFDAATFTLSDTERDALARWGDRVASNGTAMQGFDDVGADSFNVVPWTI